MRNAVFVHEQGISAALEWDASDARSWHALASAPSAAVVGTARLLPSGQIGRMAVARDWRGLGIGTRLLRALLDRADQAGIGPVFLHAQVGAVSFYAQRGFEPVGEPFVEAGIAHQRMVRRHCPGPLD